jgi:hypothetical protein
MKIPVGGFLRGVENTLAGDYSISINISLMK